MKFWGEIVPFGDLGLDRRDSAPDPAPERMRR
jgi:hypothetical protein